MEYIIPLAKVAEDGLETVGLRGMDLALLRQKLVNVPPAWILTSKGFGHFLDHNHLRPKLKQLLMGAGDDSSLSSIYQMIQDWFEKAEMPADLVDELEETCVHFKKPEGLLQAKVLLDSKKRPLWLLIPSPLYSGDAEDNEGIFMNVRGLDDIVTKLKQCWASLFSPSEIRARKKLEIPENPRMGVLLVQMIAVEVSGVAYAQATPKEFVQLKASWGLPDYTKKMSMDEYVIAMDSVQITSSTVDTQLFQWGLDIHTEELIKKPVQKSSEPKLIKKEIMELAKLAKRVRSYVRQDMKMFFLMDSQLPFVYQVNRIMGEVISREPKKEHAIKEHPTPIAKPIVKADPLPSDEPWLELDEIPGLTEKKPEPEKVPEPVKMPEPKETPPAPEPLPEVKEALKEIVEESREGDQNREALLDRLLKAKELIYEIEYLMFKNDKEKFGTKLGELKKLIGQLE